MSVELIYTNDSITLPLSAIMTVPYLKKIYMEKPGNIIMMEKPMSPEVHNVLLCINERIPTNTIKSYETVYECLKIIIGWGITSEDILSTFYGYVNIYRKYCREGLGYIYLIYSLDVNCIDMRSIIQTIDPMSIVEAALLIPDIKNFPSTMIEMLAFFDKFDYSDCFDENNANVQQKVRKLLESIKEKQHLFKVDPFEIPNYFQYSPHNVKNVWACNKINQHKKFDALENTIVSRQEFDKRFTEFTYGLIEKSINPKVDFAFPYENVVFAGNSICKLLSTDYDVKLSRSSDLDMFVIGDPNTVAATVDKLLMWFDNNDNGSQSGNQNTYYSVKSSVISVYIKDVPRMFQIVSGTYNTPYQVISHFDFTHIQWAMHCGQVFGTPSACISMKEKITYLRNSTNIHIPRLMKALFHGYDIEITGFDAINMNITDLVNNPKSEETQAHIRVIRSWYYPKSDPNLDDDELHINITQEIQRIESSNMVFVDKKKASSNVILCGDFDALYGAKLYSDFNPMDVLRKKYPGKIITLAAKYGTMRLTSDQLTVMKVNIDDEGMHIVAKTTGDKFADFCNVLETSVFNMFTHKKIEKRILTDGMMTILIPKYILNNQLTKKRSICKSKRGLVLNIETDLAVDSTFRMIFTINIDINNRLIKLNPFLIIVDSVDEELDIANIEAEVASISPANKLVVQYDENDYNI